MQTRTIKATTLPTTTIISQILSTRKIKISIMIRAITNKIIAGINKVTTKTVIIITKTMHKQNLTKIIIITKIRIAKE